MSAAEKPIKWGNSDAKKIILEDLEEGHLPLSEEQYSTQNAWERYRQLPEFSTVPFAQFKRQLEAHRNQVIVRRERLGDEEFAFKQFRKRNPRKAVNNRNEPVFDMMPGKELLRQDIKDGMHKQMSIGELHVSRKEYECLTRKKIKERVYQEVKRSKYIHYLNIKSSNWRKKKEARRSNLSDIHMDFELV